MLVLDSDVMIDILREYPPAIEWLKSLDDEEIALPGFVVMELLQGCDNKIEQEKVNSVPDHIGDCLACIRHLQWRFGCFLSLSFEPQHRSFGCADRANDTCA